MVLWRGVASGGYLVEYVRVAMVGTADTLLNDPQLKKAYLGL